MKMTTVLAVGALATNVARAGGLRRVHMTRRRVRDLQN